ncbi:MAG: response regulator transcription factor [Bacteroidetes bacterium]|jgi:DNA-binding response OmpR family regulator|nr:response regulator transcription factor [Bacteroidota bacterium]
MALKILVVEDEVKVARFLRRGLETEGYVVDTAPDGPSGERKARSESFDLIILDVLLPRKNGFEILKDLRADGVVTPVLLLTARSTTEDIVGGLDLGADDYLTKPFSFEVLLARVRSLLRRSKTRTELRVGDLQLDTVSHKALRGDRSIDLTAREYSLLEYLMRHAGKMVSRLDLAREVWGYDFDPGTNIVDVYVNHVRKKIDAGYPSKLLHTERGKGYILEDRNGTA